MSIPPDSIAEQCRGELFHLSAQGLNGCRPGAEPGSDFLTWRDAWDTGIGWVDGDHRAIARQINRLARACGEPTVGAACEAIPSDAPAPVLAALDELIDRARKHFMSEQALLRAIDYPALHEQSSSHVLQLAELTQMRRLLFSTGPRLDVESLREIKHWFLEHVIADDPRYATFYHHRADAPAACPLSGSDPLTLPD